MSEAIEWLLEGPPWVQYRTRIDLMDQSEDTPEVVSTRQAMLDHQQIQALLSELAGWPGHPLERHNDASHLLHKLVFIADLGIRADDPGVSRIINSVIDQQSPDGAFQILVNTPHSFGGSGEDQWVWMLCDAPSTLYALVKMGLKEDQRVQAAVNHLTGFSRDTGWPCAISTEMGSPDRRDDPCPYATLIALKALSQIPEWRDSSACQTGSEALLSLWEQRKERRPYMFAMGTDFAKLKAPLIWYDILHVLDVLTQFPWLRKDRRLLEMIDIVKAKSDLQQRFTAESVWKAWASWQFGQKKEPSPWLTMLAHRILKRVENDS